MDYGPFDATHSESLRRVRIGIVGSAQTVEGTARWIERCQCGLEAKESRQPNLFPPFPGWGEDVTFRCDFVAASEMTRVVPSRELLRISAIDDSNQATREAVSLFLDEIRALAEQNTPPDVILCALPLEVIQATVNAGVADDDLDDQSEGESSTGESALNLRGMLKAACMELRLPIQILWPTTYDSSIRIPRKLKVVSDRRVQDDATRAWNFFTALYYKANGLPWRMVRDPKQLKASYIGISFYRTADNELVHSSSAQMFDERGEGLILRGARAHESKDDRRPHLLEEDAYGLLSNSLSVFRQQHGHFPARVVLHKTSNFNTDELAGFASALQERSIDYADMIVISKSFTRLYRKGGYPPLRGTLMRLDDERAILYAKGSIEFFRTYPGMYVPRPLLFRCARRDQALKFLAEELLSLTKMNWNNTQFDGGEPITVRAARYVGDILKYVPEGRSIAPRYSFYM
ncbi:hypothetical protein AAFN88_05860 [Pelagibius sp. CAU 1746]|uniref:argonaute/piwi family protein n=1 Tax=Pelagibius sp. CAU 1746 TaxID=3140370 RepID=UPI00325A78A3